ncbi:hypothetical protein OTK49_00215 [Vibrio coralliirubri]|uniref:hypothetical protein n=1 Tax=Vibrio coralliirubri TaxID=1516159 RepID=UPI00228418C3|nr:hypothetical protein [Vibrio coralliirubri]MCY9860964.1 hypothetical protein [Vibrio coralliirubri]
MPKFSETVFGGVIEFDCSQVIGVLSNPISGCPSIVLSRSLRREFHQFLDTSGWGLRLESEFGLHGMCMNLDGTYLLYASVEPEIFRKMIEHAGENYEFIFSHLEDWIQKSCNEVIIYLEDGRDI